MKRDLAWVRAQLKDLIQRATVNAQEDRDEAEEEVDDRRATALRRAADTADHYGKELQRILNGKTFEEALADRIRRLR